MGLQIVDVDLKMPLKDFEKALQEFLDNYNISGIKYNIKSMKTKYGKNMFKLVIESPNVSEFTVIAEQDDVTGDIYFNPLKLTNFASGFYESYYHDLSRTGDDDDASMVFYYFLNELCRTTKSTYGAISPDGVSILINNGRPKEHSLAIVDNDGNVYSTIKAKKISGCSDSDDFQIEKPINEWINENKDIQQEMYKLPTMAEKIDFIGHKLISLRDSDELTANEFLDLFRQAGLLGFSDKLNLKIFKLIF